MIDEEYQLQLVGIDETQECDFISNDSAGWQGRRENNHNFLSISGQSAWNESHQVVFFSTDFEQVCVWLKLKVI